jgi:hypothetical protein
LSDAGMFTEERLATTCCFATQDKVWVTGPGGEPWEVYVVKGDADVLDRAAGSTCCAHGSDQDRASDPYATLAQAVTTRPGGNAMA